MDIPLLLFVALLVVAACIGSLITTTYFRHFHRPLKVKGFSGNTLTVSSGHSFNVGDEIHIVPTHKS